MPKKEKFLEKLMTGIKEFLVTGFFTGYIPFLPGTFGTLIGVAIYVMVSQYFVAYYIILVVLIVTAVPLSGFAEKKIFNKKNSPHIVIDEIAGFMLAMTTFPFWYGSFESLRYLVIGFVLFRLFDAWKLYPARHFDKLKGGYRIVADDLLAAIYTNLFLQFLRFFGDKLLL